jgi:hypothetical protein
VRAAPAEALRQGALIRKIRRQNHYIPQTFLIQAHALNPESIAPAMDTEHSPTIFTSTRLRRRPSNSP